MAQVIAMTASQHTRGRFPGMWRAVRRAFAALGPTRAEQILMWEAWWQANRAAVPRTGPLTCVLSLDGHRLVGSHRPVPDETRAGGTLTRAAQEQSDGDFGEGQALPQRVRGRAPASRMSRDPPRAVRRGDRYRAHVQQPGKGDRSLAWPPLRQGLASGWAGCLHTVFLPAGARLRSQIADR